MVKHHSEGAARHAAKIYVEVEKKIRAQSSELSPKEIENKVSQILSQYIWRVDENSSRDLSTGQKLFNLRYFQSLMKERGGVNGYSQLPTLTTTQLQKYNDQFSQELRDSQGFRKAVEKFEDSDFEPRGSAELAVVVYLRSGGFIDKETGDSMPHKLLAVYEEYLKTKINNVDRLDEIDESSRYHKKSNNCWGCGIYTIP